MQNSDRFFANKDCPYFPCHKVQNEDDFNCLFCYCPLYALGDKCGGNFSYIGGICKDCSNCAFPHNPKNFDTIVRRYEEIMDLAAKNHKEN